MAVGLSLQKHTPFIVPAGLILAASIYIRANPEHKFVVLTWLGLALYPLALVSLSFAASEFSNHQSEVKHGPRENDRKRTYLVALTQFNGVLASSNLLLLPLIFASDNPIYHCLLRVACFFYACKLLDLTVARASDPPTLFHDGKEVPLSQWTQHLRYTYLLLTEYRYRSFSIAVVEKGRDKPASKLWTYGPPIAMLFLAYLIPTAETLFLLILSIIYLALEFIHTVLHPSCPYPEFWQPFAAKSIISFWSIHWHQGARPFLYSLGYLPAKRLCTPLFGREVGSAMGILGTFSLSGIWHGWAAAALVDNPWTMGIWLWAIFVGHGVACVIERVLGKRGFDGGWIQGLLIWLIAVESVSMWVREGLVRLRVWIPWPL